MDSQNSIAQMVALMDRPAFCATEGVIVAVNQAAAERMFCQGQRVADLIVQGKDSYADFTGGELSLTLQSEGFLFDAAVYAVGQSHIFKLTAREEHPELQALALAARQLRNPLNNVMATSRQLFPNLNIPEDSPAMEQMSRINRGLNVLHRIICNMSDAARYAESAPRMELRDVDSILRELCEEAQVLCEFTDIRLEYTGLNSTVYTMVDSERLKRCFYNILSNAMKAMPTGGSIQIKLTRRGAFLYLTVQDSGCGTAAAGTFDRHLRSTAMDAERPGLGLGMQLIRACAAAHGGTVIVESQKGQGLRLTMSMAVRIGDTGVRTPIVDYAGEYDRGLLELSEVLPHTLYKPEKNH